MQANDARRAFPCFDEPAMKATFDLTMVRSADMTALGNGPLVNTEERDEFWVADTFDTTPYMSPYLVAFAVIDYPHLDFTDHVASPGFSGAMENWGLVHYMESYLLYDEAWSPTYRKIYVASVIAHEVAHQWFGNLVTCEWWDETWLNEGFASAMDYMALAPIDWPVAELGLYEQVFPQLEDDEYNTTATLRPEIPSPWDAWDAFSWTAYNKGASMVRMMQQILGPDTLQRGIQVKHNNSEIHYLKLQAAADNVTDVGGGPLDVASKMDSWINQIGYPLLSVQRDYLDKTVTFNQEKYNPFGLDQPSSPYE
ncbi:hypothetical protein CAPTEDRAFT_106483 [Capitella teleta]|uniref:Uncharacterized protein n=1 Tax=Capitella teleta TaxID=283909 RepID=R7UI86_CAPTE|nr:hypothetical protein CAPTEDRAFT_106483 [Capitella teleta]|eukprot:ELU05925.1 hypothetical protein CAPTEDRAFT_106483 [Capitella teleta]